MNKRPRSITVVSWIFIVSGLIGLLYHITELKAQQRFENGMVWICFVRLLAVVGGVFMLRGINWARWLRSAGSVSTSSSVRFTPYLSWWRTVCYSRFLHIVFFARKRRRIFGAREQRGHRFQRQMIQTWPDKCDTVGVMLFVAPRRIFAMVDTVWGVRPLALGNWRFPVAVGRDHSV